jgi:hypothetical protein
MKTKNTLKFFVALIAMVGFAITTFGQQPTITIQGLARVVAQVNVTKVQDLQFDVVSPGVNKTVSTAGTVDAGTATGNEHDGQYSVSKGDSTQVQLVFTLPAYLSGTGTPASTVHLPINFDNYGTGGNSTCGDVDASTHYRFDPNSANSTTPLAITKSAFNDAWVATSFLVHVGGTVVPDAAQAVGNYAGDIVLTVTYN